MKSVKEHAVTMHRFTLKACPCRDLGRAIFGEKWGNWAVAPFQWSVLVGLAITYTATAGQSLQVGPDPLCPGIAAWLLQPSAKP